MWNLPKVKTKPNRKKIGKTTCKNGQDEFRPDITLFVNGLPLVFVEVKKPNNHGGMVAESRRMNKSVFQTRNLEDLLILHS